MRAVMYHYVRPPSADLPGLRFLDLAAFERQLDWLDATFGLVSAERFERAIADRRTMPGVVLTFDDGLVDHHEHVTPALERRGIAGMFFVPTAPLRTGRMLAVHRAHLLLARFGGSAVTTAVRDVAPELIERGRRSTAFADVYRHKDDDQATAFAKRLVNYTLAPATRDRLLDDLFEHFDLDEGMEATRLYASAGALRDMERRGMVIGSHADTHPVLANLPEHAQEQEIVRSLDALRTLVGVETTAFCYPYGGPDSYSGGTIRLLAEHGIRTAFTAEPREIAADDLRSPLELPRFDCNRFPHGKAWAPTSRAASDA